MLLRTLYRVSNYTRGALYSAFSSPGCGVTWSVVTFLSGVLYLIYNEHKRLNVESTRKKARE
jgi:hypothetical protein